MVIGYAREAASSEHLQPSSYAPPINRDVVVTLADISSWESSEPGEQIREPMYLNRDDLRGKDQTTLASILSKGTTILIEDS